mgnify:CR=1 FL=1
MGSGTGRIYCAVTRHPVSLEQACGKRALSHHAKYWKSVARDYTRVTRGRRRPVKNPPRYLCFNMSAIPPARSCHVQRNLRWLAGRPEPFNLAYGRHRGVPVDAEHLGRETRSFVRTAQPTPTREWCIGRGYLLPRCVKKPLRVQCAGQGCWRVTLTPPPCPFDRVEPLTPRAWFA